MSKPSIEVTAKCPECKHKINLKVLLRKADKIGHEELRCPACNAKVGKINS
jgi:DNA-directed RNA polymerase subunit RPC12/RpoP